MTIVEGSRKIRYRFHGSQMKKGMDKLLMPCIQTAESTVLRFAADGE